MTYADEELRTLAEQIATVETVEVREAYLAFATSFHLPGLRPKPDAHGYISRELRFYRGDQWDYSAVLNKGWVLWYFRRPSFRDGQLRESDVSSYFPHGEWKLREKEFKVRVLSLAEARTVLTFLEDQLPRA